MTQMTVVVILATLMWGVSASSIRDYRFHRSTSPRNHEVSSRVADGTSSRTLYSEGGETILEDTRDGESSQNRTTNTSTRNFTQTASEDDSTAVVAVGRSHSEPRSDAVSSYYDFLVNEGSYKFWSVFQVFTAALLIYSAFAAVYYAKYTFTTMDYPDYLDDGFFFRRSGDVYYDYEDVTTARPQQSNFLGMSSSTFQRIMDALSSKKYS